MRLSSHQRLFALALMFYLLGAPFAALPGGDRLCRRHHGPVPSSSSIPDVPRSSSQLPESPRQVMLLLFLLLLVSSGLMLTYDPPPGCRLCLATQLRRCPVQPLWAGGEIALPAAARRCRRLLPRPAPQSPPRGGKTMIVPINHILLVAAALFFMGLSCTLLRRNLVMILVGMEIMLNAAGLVFVAGSAFWQQLDGQLMVLLIMAVTAAEVAVALAMAVVYSAWPQRHHRRQHLQGYAGMNDVLIGLIVLLPLCGAGLIMLGGNCWPRRVTELWRY
ncbi:MAG: NADH-quinone oxidoreductase subunit NuoK [Syntrophotaleaceae bacterium]